MDRGFIDLTIISAADIKRGSLLGADKKIAVVWVDPNRKERTKSAEGVHPVWNERLKVQLGDAGRSLKIEIRSKGAFVGDTLLGTVHIPVAEIAMDGKKEADRKSTYLVERPSGKKHGSLTLFAKIVNSQSNAAHAPTTSPVLLALQENHAQSTLSDRFSAYPPARTNLPEDLSSYPPAQTNFPAKFSSYPPTQTYEASAPLVYPPVEGYLAGQYQAAQPYPPAESCYPPPYPSSQSAPDTMQPTHPTYEPISNLPPSWRPCEYSSAAPHYNSCRPTPYPPPAANEYSVTPYPPAVTYYPPLQQYPPPQYYSCLPKHPPLHETHSYPSSCYI